MWRSSSRPPGEVAASVLGASPGIAPGLASHTATARSPGRQPFWPTQSHLLRPMDLQWPERGERVFFPPKPKSKCRKIILHIQNAIKTMFQKKITYNLLHTFFRCSSSTYNPVFENLEIGGVFCKNKECWKQLKILIILKISQIRDRSFVAHSFLSIPFLSDWLYLRKWAQDSDSRKPLFFT